ncbi:MAG: hypothetical protein ABL998_10385 [Planctomycetota bacterium]
MTRAQAWTLHAAALLVGGSGLVYAWMRYFCVPADEFALANHPLEPSVQHLHVLVAPLLVFAAALVWGEHVWRRVRSGYTRRRPTGLALFALFFPMVFSGGFVQVAEGELARTLAVWTHAASGTAWCAAYAVHLALHLRRGKIGPSGESAAASRRSA